MSVFVKPELGNKVQAIIFGDAFQSPEEKFLQTELARYVPQLVGKSDEEIADFVKYQRGIYLEGRRPVIGTPIASLNPTFTDSLDLVHVHQAERQVYTRASIKENGYRMQIHRRPSFVSSYTRQFTRYDWDMLPELRHTRINLPVIDR